MHATLKAKWFWYSVLCLVCFAGFGIVSKLGLNQQVPDRTMFYLFIWGSLPVALAMLTYRKFRLEKSAKGTSFGIIVGILGGAGQYAILVALDADDANTSVIFAGTGLYPMVTAVLAVVLLRERLVPVQVVGLGLAACAIVIFSRDPEQPFAAGLTEWRGLPDWFWPAAIVLGSWGVVGIFQKLATVHISPDSTMILQTLGYFLFLPFVIPEESLSAHTRLGLVFGLLGGTLTNLGAWFLFSAFKNDGKVSIVAPFTALYPIVVVFLAPLILGESITLLQGVGVAFAMTAIAMLSMERQEPEVVEEHAA